MLSNVQTNQLAIGVLVVAVLALLGSIYGVYCSYREYYTLGQFPIYMLQRVMTRVLWRTEVEGRIPIGLHQGAVVVSNHIGPIDPAFIECARAGPCIGWWPRNTANIRYSVGRSVFCSPFPSIAAESTRLPRNSPSAMPCKANWWECSPRGESTIRLPCCCQAGPAPL